MQKQKHKTSEDSNDRSFKSREKEKFVLREVAPREVRAYKISPE